MTYAIRYVIGWLIVAISGALSYFLGWTIRLGAAMMDREDVVEEFDKRQES